jgi:hypothetical protein
MALLAGQILFVAVVALGSAKAFATPAPPPALPRVAVAEIGEFHVAKTLSDLGPDVVIKAAAQGIRDVCLDPATSAFRAPTSCDRPAASTPTGVCSDMTIERALARMAICQSSDRALYVVELPSSPCRTSECLKSDAKQAGATHVLVVQGKSSDFGLDVAMDLIDLESGAVQSKRYKDYFPANEREDAAIVPRTGPQVIGIIHGMARDLVQASLAAQLTGTPASLGTAPDRSTSATPPPTAPPPQEGRITPPWVGWTAGAVGAAVMVGGAILWSLDGERSGCSDGPSGDLCPTTWDTKKVGIPLVIVGALGAGLGSWLIYRSAQGSDVAISAAPAGLALLGNF